VTDMERITEAAKQMHEAVTDIGNKGQRGNDFLGDAFDPNKLADELEKGLPKVNAFANSFAEVFKGMADQVKGYMANMAGDMAFSIGEAIGAGKSVGDVMAATLASMAVQIPKMVGMAMLNAAMSPTNSAIALPLALGGIALLGLSGIISGVQQKNNAAKEADLSGISGGRMSGNTNGSDSPQGLAQAATNGQMGIIELNIDGQKIAQAMYGPMQNEGKKRAK
jgi:hypothetical protein